MTYDNRLIAGKLRRWEGYLSNFKLPLWEEIPDLGLFMDQVIELLKQYLDYLPPELKEEQFITAATINNYVRTKIMPKPVKKRYYRVHIAYLIIICTLKQTLSISTIGHVIPPETDAEEVQRIYDSYVLRHRQAADYFIEQVRIVAGPILEHEDDGSPIATGDTGDLITFTAIIGGFSKLLAEKLLLLEGKTLENGGSIEIRKGRRNRKTE
ncbi:MAG: DUF1836 domain-containing protein [Lachnospiraceae bacterium]|nr:DUF1836 domain-containing protein [Lachnospiraceae bacterium]